MPSLLSLVLLALSAPAGAGADPLPECSDLELRVPRVSAEEADRLRMAPPPVVEYAASSGPESWGFEADLRIDAQGQVTCYRLQDRWQEAVDPTPERNAWVAGLARLRYRPFERDGRAQAAVVHEQVIEIETPALHRPLPEVALDQVSLRLQRGPCFGSCPVYSVQIHGDGRVVYRGDRFVDVEGEHHYRIAPEAVQALVDSAREKDLWSMKSDYSARITDNPTYTLTLRMGDATHSIRDYVGEMAGMPAVVTAFEQEVDAAADSAGWIRLSSSAVDRLQEEGFDFGSAEASALLARAIANEQRGEETGVLRMLELGTPTTGVDCIDANRVDDVAGDPLLDALRTGRAAVARALIDAGALRHDEADAASRIEAAFQAAIAGGNLDAVQLIWEHAGESMRPSLWFADRIDGGAPIQVPVTLLLTQPARDAPRQLLPIARWLQERGCDLRARAADGHTLLHVAADANDAEFVSYLLQQGLDPSTPGAFDLPALSSTNDETVAMLLLEAGTDPGRLDDTPGEFRNYAESQGWQRVLAWLDGHPD